MGVGPDLIDGFRDRRICVVGDIIADIYIYGKPHKLSREAPVVVIKYEHERICPGSAATRSTTSLPWAPASSHRLPRPRQSGRPSLRALRRAPQGRPAWAREARREDRHQDEDTRRDTHTSKQQVIRVDRELERALPAPVREEMRERFEEVVRHVDAIVLSDYEYGLVDHQMRERAVAMARSRTVVGDSRFNLSMLKGITMITPNESEAYALAGAPEDEDVEDVGRSIIADMGVEALLVTRGNKGMSLFLKDGRIHHIPISGSDEIADVTGAGDTVAATVTLALASGADYYTASRIANCAAGVVVMKRGTAVVTAEELKEVIGKNGSLDW
jgi:rfaE bifunctional protein kinase chain/domain